MLIEADFWEATAADCTELFPAASIVSRRLNPSKCLCVLATLCEGRGPRLEQGQTTPGCLHFPFHLFTYILICLHIHLFTTHPVIHPPIHPSTHPPFCPPIHLSIHPPFCCHNSFTLSLSVHYLSTTCQTPFWDPKIQGHPVAHSLVVETDLRASDKGKHGHHTALACFGT